MSAFDQLSEFHKAFVMAAVKCNFNASAAYRDVKPDAAVLTARTEGHRVINRPDVKAALEEWRLETLGSPTESLARMQMWARASIADVTDEDGNLDLVKARETGAIHAIKSITYKTWFDKGKGAEVTQTTVELHDAKDAEKILMKYHGLLVDVIKVKDLPTNPDELAAWLVKEAQRITGRPVVPRETKAPN